MGRPPLMPGAEPDLVFCSGTRLAGSFREVVECAAAGGFQGISVWPSQLAMDRDAGLSVVERRLVLQTIL